MKRAFVEETFTVNIREYAPGKHEKYMDIEGTMVPIVWEEYLLGSRPWFLCPDCYRRCLKLHYYENKWSCRICHKLVYHSQWYSKYQRLLDKEMQLRMLFPNGKPKGMHWRKYRLYKAEYRDILNILIVSDYMKINRNKQKFLRIVNVKDPTRKIC